MFHIEKNIYQKSYKKCLQTVDMRLEVRMSSQRGTGRVLFAKEGLDLVLPELRGTIVHKGKYYVVNNVCTKHEGEELLEVVAFVKDNGDVLRALADIAIPSD